MLSRRTFTRLAASLAAGGLVSAALAPTAGAREVYWPLEADELEETDEDEPTCVEDPETPDQDCLDQDEDEEEGDEGEGDEGEDEDEEGEGEGEDSGNALGKNKEDLNFELTPEMLATHDNGKHLGLLKPRKDEKPRGLGLRKQLKPK
jgi:hypothetical protein